jgi:hypothetical protein
MLAINKVREEKSACKNPSNWKNFARMSVIQVKECLTIVPRGKIWTKQPIVCRFVSSAA